MRHSRRASAASVSAGSVSGRGSGSVELIGVGLLFLALFLVVLITQIQTNEALVMHGGQVDLFRPNWDILLQIPRLLLGQLTPDEAIATVVGWGIEAIYLGCIVGWYLMHEATAYSGRVMALIFGGGKWIIVAVNFWADFNYGTIGSSDWGHIAFASIASFIVGFFGTIGVFFLKRGWYRA